MSNQRHSGTRADESTVIGDWVETVNALQDRLVARFFVPYGVTFAYWAFTFVFLYLGLQKVVPHRSTADVQLATIGGLLGIPYIPFVTFVGLWQMAIGGLFLFRRLRLCAWFFFSYQFFTFSTLVVLRKIVFQPPWLHVLGMEVPWALGSYAAFIMKNLVVAAVFFVLASVEIDPAGGGARREANGGRNRPLRSALSVGRGFVSGLLTGRIPGERHLNSRSSPLARGSRGLRARVPPVRRQLSRWSDRIPDWQGYLVSNYFRPHGVAILYLSFAFVFFYFGFQKPSPAYSPVRTPLADFLPHFGIPLQLGMLFIGTYEMFLGLLFLFKEIRVAFWLFLPHQAVTFLSLAVIPFVAFQPPWVSLFGVQFPWALTGYGAFVVKNVVFVAGFCLLVRIELGHTSGDAESTRDAAGTDEVGELVDTA